MCQLFSFNNGQHLKCDLWSVFCVGISSKLHACAAAVPLDAPGVHVVDLEYSPLVGGFAVVLSDGRAAFLTASTLKFDPNVSY